MKLKLTKRVPTEVEVEISFPVIVNSVDYYERSRVEHWVRIEESGAFVSILNRVAGSNVEWEVERKTLAIGAELARYATDIDFDHINEEAWEHAKAALRAFLLGQDGEHPAV